MTGRFAFGENTGRYQTGFVHDPNLADAVGLRHELSSFDDTVRMKTQRIP